MVTSFSQRKKQHRRKSFLSFECLEDRKVLAGNVTAMNSGGFLMLIGDSAANQVSITQNANGTLQLSSLDANTTFNGRTGPLTLGAATSGALILMGEGNDVVQIAGTAATPVTFGGATTIDLGGGNDTLRLSNLRTASSLNILGGTGDDQIVVQRDLANAGATTGFGLDVGGNLMIQTLTGNDSVSIRNASVRFVTVLDANAGNDTVDIRNTTFNHIAILIGGIGTDSLNNAGNTFAFLGRPISILFETQTAINGPVAVNDTVTVAEGGTVAVNVLGNDTATSGALNVGTVTIVQQPLNGTVSVNPTTGVVTYTHLGGENTSDSFTYTVTDVNGNVSNVGTVNVTVTPVNDLPTLAPVADVTTNEDVAVGPIAVTVADAEGPVTLTATSSNTAVVANSGIVIGGTVTNPTITINPVANAFGTTTITLTGTDSNGATVTETFDVTVAPVNDAPTIAPLPQDIVLGIGEQPTDPVIVVADADLDNVTVTATSSAPGVATVSVVQQQPGTYALDLTAVAPGTTTITVTANDGNGGITVDTFTVQVVASVRPTIALGPEVVQGAVNVQEDSTQTIGLTVTNPESPGEAVVVTAVSSDQSVITNASLVYDQNTGTLAITPVANAVGSSTITVTATDAAGLTTTQTFVVNVAPVNDPPIAVNDLNSVNVPSGNATATVSGNLLTNDLTASVNDGPSALFISAVDLGNGLVPVPAGGLTVTSPSTGATITINQNGAYTYTFTRLNNSQANIVDTALAFLDELPDEISYEVSDSLATDVATLTVNLVG